MSNASLFQILIRSVESVHWSDDSWGCHRSKGRDNPLGEVALSRGWWTRHAQEESHIETRCETPYGGIRVHLDRHDSSLVA